MNQDNVPHGYFTVGVNVGGEGIYAYLIEIEVFLQDSYVLHIDLVVVVDIARFKVFDFDKAVCKGEIDGLTAAEMIKNRYPKIKIILATSMAETDWMSRAKQIGIESFWYKEYSNLSLIEIMDRTMDGENLYLDKPPAVFLGKLKITDLTVQQKNLLRYLTRGLSNKEIAEKMFIEPSTVKTHLDFIMNKTGIHSRTELAVKAANLGLSLNTSS